MYWVKVMDVIAKTFPLYLYFRCPKVEAKTVSAAGVAETNWKHEVRPDRDDLIRITVFHAFY